MREEILGVLVLEVTPPQSLQANFSRYLLVEILGLILNPKISNLVSCNQCRSVAYTVRANPFSIAALFASCLLHALLFKR